jgi:hypothetical protein
MWWSFLAFFVGVLCGRSVWFMRRMRSMNVAEARANARAAAQATATGVVIVGDGLGAVDAGGVAGVSGVLGAVGPRGALVHGREVIDFDWSEADERVTA